MKTSTLLKSLSAITVTTFVTLGTAHAGMGPCMFGSPGAACANQPGSTQACPRQDNVQGTVCVTGNAELGGMMGNMATGGLQIAAGVMRTLLDQAGKVVGPSGGM